VSDPVEKSGADVVVEDAPAAAVDNAAQDAPKAGDETLGDAGKKALIAERAEKKALAKANAELIAKVKAFEDAQLSDTEKQSKRLAELEKEAASARSEAIRYRIAAKFQVSDEDAELFLTGSDEESLTKQATRLSERAAAAKPKSGAYVPGEGRTTQNTPNIDDEIAAAQKARNFTRVIALKEQQSAQQRASK
jgi:hypothetical protein